MDPYYIYLTAALIVGTILAQVFRKTFDPFAPIWLFLVGYAQVYVVQALSYRDYALRVRGADLVAAGNFRALWALAWFLLVYYLAPTRRLARRLPAPPRFWSPGLLSVIAPLMVLWGLFCAGVAITIQDREMSTEEDFFHNFPMVMLVAGIWVLVTGRSAERPRPAWTAAGLAIVTSYVLIWMFNGKRSHSLIGVLTGLCAYYAPRYRRPSKPVLALTALLGAMVLTLAIGWRDNYRYERSITGFMEYLGDFSPDRILVNINLKDREDVDPNAKATTSYETEEYCAYLLMLDTVPEKSDHDYGESYIRLVSTFIPRKFFWENKPYFGREQWVNAWIAGSEFKRDATFTGPAISILGATQLNGGAVATVIVLGVIAVLIRTAYEYFRRYTDVPWAQAWWALTYYNAWLMTVNDDPFVWFYYNYGFTTLIPMSALLIYLVVAAPRHATVQWMPAGAV